MHVKGLISMAFLLSKLGFWGLIGSVIASGAIVVGTIVVINDQLENCYNKISSLIDKEINNTNKSYDKKLIIQHVNKLIS